MEDNSTLNNLIKLAYGEISDDQRSVLLRELISDPEKAEKLNEILAIKDKLDAQKFEPSDTSLQIVLNHSRNSKELETFC